MKTIEDIRKKARKILKSPMEIDDKIDAFLDIVIGEVEREYRIGDIIQYHRHPITIRDAIEREVK